MPDDETIDEFRKFDEAVQRTLAGISDEDTNRALVQAVRAAGLEDVADRIRTEFDVESSLARLRADMRRMRADPQFAARIQRIVDEVGDDWQGAP